MTTVYSYGRLGGDPIERTTKTGATMATATLAADVGNPGDDEGGPLWLGLLAFGSVADELLRHRKGDLLGIAGRLQLNKWTDQQGVEHERLQAVVQQVASAKTVRPGNGKKRTADTAPATSRPPAPAPSAATPGRFDVLEVTADDIV